MLEKFQHGGRFDIFARRYRAVPVGGAVGFASFYGFGEILELIHGTIQNPIHETFPFFTGGIGALAVALAYGSIAGHSPSSVSEKKGNPSS